MLVGFRVACRGRVELHEVEGPDIELGRDPGADLCIQHASVAPRHARLLVRRGRLILSDLGHAKTGTTRSRERVLAPVTLGEREPFGIGDVALEAWIEPDGEVSWTGCALRGGLRVEEELESPAAELRRYRVELGDGEPGSGEGIHADGGRGELVTPRVAVPIDRVARWRTACARSAAGRPPFLAPIVLSGERDARAFVIERVPPGIRLDALLAGLERGAVRLPLEAALVILAHLAEALVAARDLLGAHGALDPRSVHLGADGSVSLLRPGPSADAPEAIADEYLAPERRFGLPPTAESDAFSLGVLGKTLLAGRVDCPVRVRALCYWLAHVDPARRPKDLAALAAELTRAAQGEGLDPTFGHVARVVRVLAPSPSQRLCTVPSLRRA